MPEPRIEGLSHMTFIVENLDGMEEILVTVLGARKIYDSEDKTFSLSQERFFHVGATDLWIAIMQGQSLPSRSYNHIAFKFTAADLETYRQRIEALGLDMRETRPRVAGEGRSLYFHDRDNHLFELHTGTLPERLERYKQPPVESHS